MWKILSKIKNSGNIVVFCLCIL